MIDAACNCCKCSRVPKVKSSQAWDWQDELRKMGWKQSECDKREWTCPRCVAGAYHPGRDCCAGCGCPK